MHTHTHRHTHCHLQEAWTEMGEPSPRVLCGLGTPRQQAPCVVTHTRGGGACPGRNDQSRNSDTGYLLQNPPKLTALEGKQSLHPTFNYWSWWSTGGVPRPAPPGKYWKYKFSGLPPRPTESEALGGAEPPVV